MRSTTLLATAAAISASALAAAVAQVEEIMPHVSLGYIGELRHCQGKPYYLGFYECYSFGRLCPIIDDVHYQPCGYYENMACYNPKRHGCINDRLVNILECNANVYDDKSHTCADNQTGGHQLCPIERPHACGDVCYSETTDQCIDGQLVQGPMPCPDPNYPNNCGGTCYPPFEQWMCDMNVMLIPARTCSRYDIPLR